MRFVLLPGFLLFAACEQPVQPPITGTLFGVARSQCLLSTVSGGAVISSEWTECTPASRLDAVPGRSSDGWFVAFTDGDSGQRRVFDPKGNLLAVGASSLTGFAGLDGRWYASAATTIEMFDSTGFRPLVSSAPGTQYFDISIGGKGLVVLEADAQRRALLREFVPAGGSLVDGRVVELPLLADAVRITEWDETSVLLTDRARSRWARVAIVGASTPSWVAGAQACLGGDALHVFSAGTIERFANGGVLRAKLPDGTDGILCTCDPDRLFVLRQQSVSSFDWQTETESAVPGDKKLTFRMLLRCPPK